MRRARPIESASARTRRNGSSTTTSLGAGPATFAPPYQLDGAPAAPPQIVAHKPRPANAIRRRQPDKADQYAIDGNRERAADAHREPRVAQAENTFRSSLGSDGDRRHRSLRQFELLMNDGHAVIDDGQADHQGDPQAEGIQRGRHAFHPDEPRSRSGEAVAALTAGPNCDFARMLDERRARYRENQAAHCRHADPERLRFRPGIL